MQLECEETIGRMVHWPYWRHRAGAEMAKISVLWLVEDVFPESTMEMFQGQGLCQKCGTSSMEINAPLLMVQSDFSGIMN